MNKSESIAALSAALAKAQAEMSNASKTSENPHFKSKYADLAEVLNTVRPVMAKHGIAIIQMPSFVSGVASVETLMTHSSGEWISNICSAPVSKQDAQGVGSAITYLRRYSLAAFAGVAQEDDDGNSAVYNHQEPTPAAATRMGKAATDPILHDIATAPDSAALKQIAEDAKAICITSSDPKTWKEIILPAIVAKQKEWE
jgi:hypothetical protein